MQFNKIEPNVWKPENEGDEITGVLIKVEPSKTYDSKVYHLEFLTSEQLHKQFVIFGTTVLDDRMSYIKVGDVVKIVFKGFVDNKKGQPTKIFEVFKGEEEKGVVPSETIQV